MSAKPRVLVIGDVMQDVIVRPSGPLVVGSDRAAHIEIHPGGSAASQAVWMARCGLAVDFVARVGRADVAALTRDFADVGVWAHLAADDRAQTGRLIALLDPDGQRSFLTDRGANENLCAADVDWRTLPTPDFVQLSGYSVVTEATRAHHRARCAKRRAARRSALIPPPPALSAKSARRRFSTPAWAPRSFFPTRTKPKR